MQSVLKALYTGIMTNSSQPLQQPQASQALTGVRILSLCLNLPGPAALQRCRKMGAICTKLEPPAPQGTACGDPMMAYSGTAYAALHQGIQVQHANLKTEDGQRLLHAKLRQTQILLTSFRPSALQKLGLDWATLHARYPALSQVAIVGSLGARAEEPGHDLTYLAENDLVTGLELPATLYADMGGALMATEAVLQAVLLQRQSGRGQWFEVALSQAAAHLAQPRAWGLTLPGTAIGGGHAGYQVYPCQDGRVALAALEPHFAKSLCTAAGLQWQGLAAMAAPQTHQAIAEFVAARTRAVLDDIARKHDIPLKTLL